MRFIEQEQADAAAERESRRAAAVSDSHVIVMPLSHDPLQKEKLLQLRRERELEEFENEHKV